jgi:hypothetical protein
MSCLLLGFHPFVVVDAEPFVTDFHIVFGMGTDRVLCKIECKRMRRFLSPVSNDLGLVRRIDSDIFVVDKGVDRETDDKGPRSSEGGNQRIDRGIRKPSLFGAVLVDILIYRPHRRK